MTNTRKPLSYRDYNTGHPWYYHLGGPVLSLKAIREAARYSRYKGYRKDDIAKADKKPEPQRSHALRTIRAQVVEELKRDIAGYRKRALALHRHRKNAEAHPLCAKASCADVHTNISLKHNHLVNDFAHLIWLDDLLNRQGDLFGV